MKSSIILFVILFHLFEYSLLDIYTHSQAQILLSAAGIEISPLNATNCNKKQATEECRGISLDGIHIEAVDGPSGIITLKMVSQCQIRIVGATEIDEEKENNLEANNGNCSHKRGWKLDIEKNYCMNGYIRASFKRVAKNVWQAGSGNIYAEKGKHWEIVYLDACLHSALDDLKPFQGNISKEEAELLYRNASAAQQSTHLLDVCSQNGGVCLSDKKYYNWCTFDDKQCQNPTEEPSIKCCVPNNWLSCESKGGQCKFANACNLSTSIILENLCAKSRWDVECCIPGCELRDGQCTRRHLCHLNASRVVENVCPQSTDLICCIPTEHDDKHQQHETANLIPILILLLLFAIFAIIGGIILHALKWKNMRQRLISQTTISTMSSIASSKSGSTNLTLELHLDRTERPKTEGISNLNDLLMFQEFGSKWLEIQKNSAHFKINGEFYANVDIEKEMKKICDLGTGNFSQVHLYRYRNFEIAVKRIRLIAGAEMLKRAFVDLSVLQNCNHSSIVAYYGYFFAQDHFNICMESMRVCFWKILEVYLQRKRGMPEAAVRTVLFNVVLALEYLQNKHGIMHRDVKPSNILLGPESIKLCDFGIAGRLKESKGLTVGIGCLAYMAPERLNSNAIYDAKADVWSVGVTGLEMISGRHPFEINIDNILK